MEAAMSLAPVAVSDVVPAVTTTLPAETVAPPLTTSMPVPKNPFFLMPIPPASCSAPVFEALASVVSTPTQHPHASCGSAAPTRSADDVRIRNDRAAPTVPPRAPWKQVAAISTTVRVLLEKLEALFFNVGNFAKTMAVEKIIIL
jgi:hypothetical protein